MQAFSSLTLFTRHPLQIRFVLTGAWNTVFAILVFIGLDAIFAHVFSPRYIAYMAAMASTNILSVANAFILHKYWTFRSRTKGIGLMMEFFRFSCTYAFVFALTMLLLPVFTEVFHIAPRISAVIGIIISIIVSYTGHSRFSFKRRDRAK
jgi:putative flippase GtrA